MKIFEPINNYIKKREREGGSVRTVITLAYSVVMAVSLGFLGFSLYWFFSGRMRAMAMENTNRLIAQTSVNLQAYLQNIRLISDTIYLRKIKDTDIYDRGVSEWMSALYEENKDYIVSISCYDIDGTYLAGMPGALEKENTDVRSQEWFLGALYGKGSFFLSVPHVQNLFVPVSYDYKWVVSLSRLVDFSVNGEVRKGVLLLDMDFSGIEKLMEDVNLEQLKQYVYLCDSNGRIIYHPRQEMLLADLYRENSLKHREYGFGTTEEIFLGERRSVFVSPVKKTDWRIICVTPRQGAAYVFYDSVYFVVLFVVVSITAALLMNLFVSRWVTGPIEKLTDSVKVLPDGTLDSDIYSEGNSEVRYLGATLKNASNKMRALSENFKKEEHEKRKNEFEALQSQINPHFLYNTLDSIVWMIEGGQEKGAVFMIKELASLFRISLSRGKTIIPLRDEIKHAKNYMNIQSIRYRGAFSVDFSIDRDILDAACVKLILQPVLENAIEYGVSDMDGEGEIHISGWLKDGDIYLKVSDNGLGMREEVSKNILSGTSEAPARGSGVGLKNVHRRLRLYFGDEYGLFVESEPDEGTTVFYHLPKSEAKRS